MNWSYEMQLPNVAQKCSDEVQLGSAAWDADVQLSNEMLPQGAAMEKSCKVQI